VLGHVLGGVTFIHDHLESALILIVAISVIPMIVEYVLAKRRERKQTSAGVGQEERAAVMEKLNGDS
jgi:membrane-associated protein